MAYELPELGYSYDALEPFIDAKTMEIHYSKHHQAYTNNLNAALEKHEELQAKTPEELLKELGTISEDNWSLELYKVLFAEFSKQFTEIKSFYVGKGAVKKLGDGVRLTTNIKSPIEYDLHC